MLLTLSVLWVAISGTMPAGAETNLTIDLDDRTPLTKLRDDTVIEVLQRIPLTRGAFRQVFKDGRRQGGEYRYTDDIEQDMTNLPRWGETCEMILHVSKRPQKIRPNTRLNLADTKIVPGENGGVYLMIGNNDQVQAIRCTAKHAAKDTQLTIGDLKRAFGGRLRIL